MMRRCFFSLVVGAGIVLSIMSPRLAGQTTSAWDQIPDHVRERKPFKRHEWFYRQRAFPADTIPYKVYLQALAEEKRIEARRLAERGASELTWMQLGPGSITSTFPSQWGRCSGRIRGLDVHPTDPNIAYVGAASGGIWKTTDGGASWLDIGSDLASLTFGAIAIDPSNPDVVYAGSGEAMRFFNSYTYDGRGLFKSTDGGASWVNITNGFGAMTHFSAVRVSPADPNIVYAALASGYSLFGNPGNEGIWRSADAGVTWTRVLGTNDGFDVLPHPTVAGRVYAALGGGSSGGSTPGFFVSTDHGATWSNSSSGLPAASSIDRMHIDVSPSSPSIIYTLIYQSASGGSIRLFKSTDDGASWAAVSPSLSSSQGWYDLVLAVNPADANEVYIGDAELRRTTNGGTSFSYVGGSYWNQAMHVDFHTMAFAPSNPSIRYVGCDGGVYRSNDGGASWLHRNNGLTTIQFYRLGSHPTDPDIIIGGAQDNGLYRTLDGGGDIWHLISTGDGMEIFFDYSNPSYVYASTQYAGLIRSSSGGGYGTFTSIRPSFGSEPVAWLAPFFMHPNNPTWIYTASNRPYLSTDRGNSWTALSPALASSAINSMDISTVNPDNMILVAGSGPNIMVSTNGGYTWTDVTAAIPGPHRYTTRVVCHPNDAQTMFVVRSGFGPGQIFRTNNLGATWTDISGNLPQIPHNDFFVDPVYESHFYAANDFGVYRSTDGGVTWMRESGDIPYVPVFDFKYSKYGTTRILRVGTYGRSLFQTTLPRIMGSLIAVDPSYIDFGTVETGTHGDTLGVSIFSQGTDTLVISSITSPASPEFLVHGIPGLPLLIEPDSSFSFQVSFHPSQPGVLIDSLVIVSNDSANSQMVVILQGKGVTIAPAEAGVMYAAGTTTSGTSLYTINLQTGDAAAVAELALSEVHALAIRPGGNELYAFRSSPFETEAYRLSAQDGEIVFAGQVAVGNARAFTFSSPDTLLAATLTGSLYKIAVTSGDTLFVGAEPDIVYASLSISPTSGAVWASVRSPSPLTGRDRIYTLDPATGAATLVGQTGDNQITPSIGFTPTGRLIGLKGAGSQENTIIEIDTLNAHGTLIGATGVTGLAALAMRTDSVVVKIARAEEAVVPLRTSIVGNFPNPFNPATHFEIHVAARQEVALKVYDILGREVATLVNSELQPGIYRVMWDADGMSSGVYFYRFRAGDVVETKKLMLLK